MSAAGRSDAATSTDDIKGRPLCLFYFAHPFGVLSCEPPTVVAPAAAACGEGGVVAAAGAMSRRPAAWPPAVPARRLPPYTRILPPLQLPTPRDLSSLDGSEDVWSRSSFLPPDKVALPPIELPSPSPTPPAPAGGRRRRAHRLGPVGVRKSGSRSRGALARLLRRAVASGGSGGGCRGSARDGRAALAGVRAAWRAADARAGSGLRSSGASLCSNGSESISAGGESAARIGIAAAAGHGVAGADAAGAVAAEADMESRGAFSPGLLRRRYSVPETVMRRYQLAREQSEAEQESARVSEPVYASRSPVHWRVGGVARRSAGSRCSPCRCAPRSLVCSRSEASVPPATPAAPLPPPSSAHSLVPASEPASTEDSNPLAPSTSDIDVLEIVVTATAPTPHPRTLAANSVYQRLDIDEYVSGILVDSLNSLTDRLEHMTVAVGGEGGIAVVEKEIKVKLQNAGVNTVVHLSPTSNNQIIFGNEELCERKLQTPSKQALEAPAVSSWAASPRTGATSPCISLVDSLEDPSSPRIPPSLAAPLYDSQCPKPTSPSQPPQQTKINNNKSSPMKEKSESFFIRMTDDDECACERENVAVADHMPERIKRRLHRRHRRREMRAQGARRGASRRDPQRDVRRQCAMIVDALVDDAVARIAREEYRCARIARRRGPMSTNDYRPRPPQEDARTLHARGSLDTGRGVEYKQQTKSVRPPTLRHPPLPPSQNHDRGPRRLYHKSEIHDGGKCIEILEIVEYANLNANASRSSSETNSDESIVNHKTKKSRIPVPILDKSSDTISCRRSLIPRSGVAHELGSASLASTRRFVEEGRAPPECVRFERPFDAIPEERSSLSLESAGEEPPLSRPVPARRSAATSPRMPPGCSPGGREEHRTTRELRSVGTQWAQLPKGDKRAVTREGGAALQSGERTSSECDSAEERPARRRPQPVARRRSRPRRTSHHSASSALPPAAPDAGRPQAPAVCAGAEGWSLTLAGSCKAALPARLDLRLRFPSRSAYASPVDCGGETRSQDTEWSTSDRTTAPRRAPAPAIRSDVSDGSPLGTNIAVRPRRKTGFNMERYVRPAPAPAACGGGRRRAEPPPPRHARAADVLPALGAPPLPTQSDPQGRRVRCCSGRSPAPQSSRGRAAAAAAAAAARTAASSARLGTALAPPAADIALAHHRCVCGGGGGEAAPPCVGGGGGGAQALAVLGSAIVPERRAAPPTASERDPVRARRARAAARRASSVTSQCDLSPARPDLVIKYASQNTRPECKQKPIFHDDVRRKNPRVRY